MGRFFKEFLESSRYDVHVIESDTDPKVRKDLLKDARTVIVSVPIPLTESVIEQLLPDLNTGALLIDLTSLKAKPLQAMLKHSGEVLALHPMFAPSPQGITGQTIVDCGGRIGSLAAEFRDLLTQNGVHLCQMGAKQHDELMAVVQGMNHFHSIAFAHAVGKLGVSIEDTISVASPVYLARIQMMGRILAQDAGLYADILLQNQDSLAALRAFMNSCQELLDAVSSGSRERCIEFFQGAATSFGDYRYTALQESEDILEVIKALRSEKN